ncbi:MAG: hypothetical protein HN535_00190, partial [Flavobacteriales bacterium]|nr:hypothetical protein [Flavobacteriales bacterium]
MRKKVLIFLFCCLTNLSFAQVITTVNNSSVVGDTITAYLTIDNCISVGSFNLGISWNQDSLVFLQATNYHDNLVGGYATIVDTSNFYYYQWIDIFNGSTGGLNIQTGDTLFELTFVANYLPSQVHLSITTNEFFNLFSSPLPSAFNNGVIIFYDFPDQSTITAGEYFWGTTDPGVGNGTTLLAMDGNWDESLESVFEQMSLPAYGSHTFNIRV